MENLLYEGKAKKVYKTENPNEVIIYYKDDATAFNGVKKASISNKGILNNKITEILFTKLSEKGIPNHFIKRIDDRSQLCQKVDIVPLEFIVRNYIAGSMSKRLRIKEGTKPDNTIFEICYKKDELGDPLINDHHAVALELCTYEELHRMYSLTNEINEILKDIFDKEGIILVDFKIEFGKNNNGEILLADEISPDTSRLWDKKTLEKLDKDRFRRDLGSIEEAYIEILNRIN
ncbi:Phosphoribosylaminoimidazole-succinocarboxamide synthase [Candidatus Izimaplasma bacterium HR1]|jgi:phosphoribosylaminoimidazole-succinocarboxamide synthase|uniref:phosphoribosylaminoimidazolesuccinocarboxamide synthase n=1 Tax=Candidatus Izimoplasma sp. HR1 TaxID=1541959 RepID=UPI0004F89A07|nr:Phosphoribosylaminoimidazole-succinocarboxamide synthase [Candidatus Izimaplasma bacterium HR1]